MKNHKTFEKVTAGAPGGSQDPEPTNEADQNKSMNAQTETEPMATRVGLHPFLAGINEKQLALLAECAMIVEDCEKDHSLGYELLKRMAVVMNRRMQAARNKMLAIHQRGDTLERVARLSPFS